MTAPYINLCDMTERCYEVDSQFFRQLEWRYINFRTNQRLYSVYTKKG